MSDEKKEKAIAFANLHIDTTRKTNQKRIKKIFKDIT